jgi:lysophospholipase L1-like esterase
MRRSLGPRVLLFLVVGVLTTGALELGARWANARWQLDLCLEGEMEFDRELFWRLPRQGWRDRVPVEIGPLHLREHQHHHLREGEAARRVLCVGDSSIFGYGVAPQDTFEAVLEEALIQACPQVHWLVLNGGTPGYSTHQSLRLLERHDAALDPDLLVVGNLYDDAMHWKWTDRELEERLSSPVARLSMGLRSLSRASAVGRAVTCELRKRDPERFGGRESIPWETLRSFAERAVDGPVRMPIEDYRANITAMIDHMEAREGAAMGLLLARESEVRDGARDPLMDSYRRAMVELMDARGYPTVDVREAFEAGLPPGGTLWLDEVHPNELGHAIVGQRLADAIAAGPLCSPSDP